MAANTYRPPNRNGPPPPQQQQYGNQYDDRYDQRDYNPRVPRPDYDQYSQEHDGYNDGYYGEQQYESYNDQYNQYEQWENGPHHEPQNQGPYTQQYQQYEQAPRQQRPYQYDDRYRMGGPNRPPGPNMTGRPAPRNGDGRPPPPNGQFRQDPRGNMNYNQRSGGGGVGEIRHKARERILQNAPDSPKTSSWDNPFPAFPSKKKQTESQTPEANDQAKDTSVNVQQPQDIQRPSTSNGSRQRVDPPLAELPRPRTSHSQRNVDLHDSLPHPNPMPMPMRKDGGGPRPQPNYHQEAMGGGNPPRPGPRRAMTGPVPEQEYHDPNQQGYHYQQNDSNYDARYANYPPQTDLPHPRTYNDPPPNQRHDSATRLDGINAQGPPPQHRNQKRQPFNGNSGSSGHQRQSSDQGYRRNSFGVSQDVDSGTYRGVPLTKKISPEVPNFDALPMSPTEKVEDHLPHLDSHDQPYSKPMYQNPAASISAPNQRQHSVDNANSLVSPLAQFSFELDADETAKQSPSPVQSPIYQDHQQSQRDYQISQQSQGQSQPPVSMDRPMQPSQRYMNRPPNFTPDNRQMQPNNRPIQGNAPMRPGLAQPPVPSPSHEGGYRGYEHEHPSYDSGYATANGPTRPPMPPSQSSFPRDNSRQGFDQRSQPRPGFLPQQVPPRPATANPGRMGPTPENAPRNSSDSYQRGGMRNPDSLPAHPVPFRPGLMQPTPPAPRPTPPPQAQPQVQPQSLPPMQQLPSSAPSKPVEPESPVTIRELNTLREEYKQYPNDYALGLRFAKRLVEAAKVLANENGRADPKQTAKNRERYILDAHKIVKRLCAAGYPEAMFYQADCYGQGMLGLETDPKEAFLLYQSAAKLGHAQAAYRVAVCCELGAEEGGGTKRDPLKAVQWYKRAASLGDTPAMYKMGMIQLKGLLGQTKSPREGISWLKRAAERADAENPHALHELGLLYENAKPTDIVLKDEQYALQLFQQAADVGYKYSQFRLGSAYEYGLLGLAIDPRMSIAWYTRAAKQGEHQSEFALSGWYLTGSGQASPGEQPLLPQSDTEAYLWARKAASSGLAKAEYAMGYYTEVGIGVGSNIEEAKRWYYRAAAQNHPKARERLEDLKKGGQRMQKTRVSRSNIGKHNEGECVVM